MTGVGVLQYGLKAVADSPSSAGELVDPLEIFRPWEGPKELLNKGMSRDGAIAVPGTLHR